MDDEEFYHNPYQKPKPVEPKAHPKAHVSGCLCLTCMAREVGRVARENQKRKNVNPFSLYYDGDPRLAKLLEEDLELIREWEAMGCPETDEEELEALMPWPTPEEDEFGLENRSLISCCLSEAVLNFPGAIRHTRPKISLWMEYYFQIRLWRLFQLQCSPERILQPFVI